MPSGSAKPTIDCSAVIAFVFAAAKTSCAGAPPSLNSALRSASEAVAEPVRSVSFLVRSAALTAVDTAFCVASVAFWAVSPQALPLRGYAEAVAGWFGREARLRFAPFDEFVASVPAEFRDAAYQHIARSHSMSVEKGRRVLGYRPEYSSLAAVAGAVEWLRKDGRLGDDVPPVLA